MSHRKQRYASDLTDQQWAQIEPLLPVQSAGQPARPIELDMRETNNAMLYIVHTGCQWENLPSNFPNYTSVYYHFRNWSLDGTLLS